jgi:glycosyltransferase involved in cell wall biosynthesis
MRSYATDQIACSEKAAAYFFGDKWKNEGNAVVLHCGVDVTPFYKVPGGRVIRRQFGIADDTLVVGTVGNLRPEKNHSFFLRIAKSILFREPGAQFFLIGDGNKRSELEREATEMGIGAKVHFLGSRSDVPSLMTGLLDVMVLPSFSEGLPVTVLESQVAGLPAVVSDRVTREVVFREDLTTFLPLEVGSEVWAATILGARKSRRTDIAVGIEKIKGTDFWMGQCARNLAALYEKAMARARKP